MLIGVPKEIKKPEERVGATPSAVASLVHAGHSVIVEKGAGVGSGFPDEEYIAAGAKMGSAEESKLKNLWKMNTNTSNQAKSSILISTWPQINH